MSSSKCALNPRMATLLTERVQIFGERGPKGPFAGLLRNRDAQASTHPVRRTTLTVKAAPVRVDGDQEVLELHVRNTGSMTALFCEPHPAARVSHGPLHREQQLFHSAWREPGDHDPRCLPGRLRPLALPNGLAALVLECGRLDGCA